MSAKLSDVWTNKSTIRANTATKQVGDTTFIASEAFACPLHISLNFAFLFQVITGKKYEKKYGKEYGKKCDVYSFGMTAWAIDAEEYPFADVESEFLLYSKIVNGERPQLCPNCNMNDIIQKCWDNVFNLFCLTLFCSVLFAYFNILFFVTESRRQTRV